MSCSGEKLRVLIPTTTGPVEVLLLTEEDPAIGRSVACVGGTTETADIDAGYHAFVARPTGVVARMFGHPCYRLDVSGRIDAGSSWQLGVLAAHALHAAGRLAQERDAAQGVIWATGSVRPVDLSIGAVSHLEEKLTRSLDRLTQEAKAGLHVLLAVPAQNASELAPDMRAELAGRGIDVLELAAVQSLWDGLALTPGETAPTVATNVAAPRLFTRATLGAQWRTRVAAAAVLICACLGGGYLLTRSATQGIGQKSATSATPASSQLPRPIFKDCDVCPEMVELPTGEFMMGSPDDEHGRGQNEGPQRRVSIAKRFALGRYEVTVDQFSTFVAETGMAVGNVCSVIVQFDGNVAGWGPPEVSFRQPGFDVTGSHPLVCVSWHEAQAYVAWLRRRTGKPYRLPTEAEWEYAARAGTITSYSFGIDESRLCDYARFADLGSRFGWRGACRSDTASYGPIPVGLLKPNPWGLFDVHGNAWEWVEDCWTPDAREIPTDGSAFARPGSCEVGLVRGGSWAAGFRRLRSAYRSSLIAASHFHHVGFRVARSLDPQ